MINQTQGAGFLNIVRGASAIDNLATGEYQSRYLALLVSGSYSVVPSQITADAVDIVKAMEIDVANYQSYSRKPIGAGSETGFGAPFLSSLSDCMVMKNTDEIHFRLVSEAGGWGTVVGFAIYSVSQNGNPLYWGPLSSAIVAAQDTVPLIKTGDLEVIAK